MSILQTSSHTRNDSEGRSRIFRVLSGSCVQAFKWCLSHRVCPFPAPVITLLNTPFRPV